MLTYAGSTIWKDTYIDSLLMQQKWYRSSINAMLWSILYFVIDLIVFLLTIYHNDNHLISFICMISCVMLFFLLMYLISNLIIFLGEKSNLKALVKDKSLYLTLDLLNNLKHSDIMKHTDPQTLKITPPAGFEIDKTNSTFEEIVFKPIKPILPTEWEDLPTIKGFYVNTNCDITSHHFEPSCDKVCDNRHVWPTRELAEASIALAQLCQLRDIYNDGWVADYTQNNTKYIIISSSNKLNVCNTTYSQRIITFKSSEIRDQFFTNFKDLLEIAKPLL